MKIHYLFLVNIYFYLFCNFAVAEKTIVIELFTSQGCSSCPPADTLLRKFAEKPNTLALSYHVDYWDGLGWKDPYSSKEATERQYFYAKLRKSNDVFTPQAIINGLVSVVGSDSNKMESAINTFKEQLADNPISITQVNNSYHVKVKSIEVQNKIIAAAEIYQITYLKSAKNIVPSGENAGTELAHINSVLEIKKLGVWTGDNFQTTITASRGDGFAILLQSSSGEIIAANWKYTVLKK